MSETQEKLTRNDVWLSLMSIIAEAFALDDDVGLNIKESDVLWKLAQEDRDVVMGVPGLVDGVFGIELYTLHELHTMDTHFDTRVEPITVGALFVRTLKKLGEQGRLQD